MTHRCDEACGCSQVITEEAMKARAELEAVMKAKQEQEIALKQRDWERHLVAENERLARKLETYKRALVEALDESRGY